MKMWTIVFVQCIYAVQNQKQEFSVHYTYRYTYVSIKHKGFVLNDWTIVDIHWIMLH